MYDIKETFRAKSVPDALELLRTHPGAIPVCGGTDVMIHLKERKLRQATLVGIMDIASLQGIRLEQTGDLFIGPGTCFDSIYQNPLARACVPTLVDACNQVGSPQIRSVATIGGNLCNGAVSADSVPSLLVLNAELELTSLEGKRVVKATGFHTGPGKTVLETGRELLTGIRIPKASYEGHGGKYLKFGQRNAMEIATLGCAVNCALSPDGTIRDFAIAFGVAAPRPIRCAKAESLMLGRRPTSALLKELRRVVLLECAPRESWRASLELRTQLIQELAERASRCAIEHAGGNIDD